MRRRRAISGLAEWACFRWAQRDQDAAAGTPATRQRVQSGPPQPCTRGAACAYCMLGASVGKLVASGPCGREQTGRDLERERDRRTSLGPAGSQTSPPTSCTTTTTATTTEYARCPKKLPRVSLSWGVVTVPPHHTDTERRSSYRKPRCFFCSIPPTYSPSPPPSSTPPIAWYVLWINYLTNDFGHDDEACV